MGRSKNRALALLYLRRKKLLRSCDRPVFRSCSVRLLDQERRVFGYYRLVQRMREVDPERFYQTFRMDTPRFDDLLSKLEPEISRGVTAADPISAGERLAIALKILAHGESQQSVATAFMVGKSTVNKILYDVCRAIIRHLQPEYLSKPTADTFKSTAQDFWRFWNFPMCLGAIDGKHIKLKCPMNSGSQYFNYKGTFSIILMACVDAQYRFVMTDIGGFGSQGDAGTFSQSAFGKAILNQTLPVPPAKALPGTDVYVPHVFVADEAFPLKMNIMRPFPGSQLTDDERRIFNYRLSRARRIVENAFGILAARWRILLNAMEVTPEHADIIVLACVILHNYLKRTDGSKSPQVRYVPPNFVDYEDANGQLVPGQWRNETNGLQGVSQQSSNMYARNVGEVRQKFVHFFMSDDGSIPNQELAALSC